MSYVCHLIFYRICLPYHGEHFICNSEISNIKVCYRKTISNSIWQCILKSHCPTHENPPKTLFQIREQLATITLATGQLLNMLTVTKYVLMKKIGYTNWSLN